MSDIRSDIEKQLEELLGPRKETYYCIDDKITVGYKEQNEAPFLWVEDRRGKDAFAWLFNIEKTENGYKFFFDKYEYVERYSLQEVFEVVKTREY